MTKEAKKIKVNPLIQQVIEADATVYSDFAKDFKATTEAWQERIKSTSKDWESFWLPMGKVLLTVKKALPATKDFGAWRDKAYPTISPSFGSCAIKAYVHRERLTAWLKDNGLAINNPMTVINRYQSAMETRLIVDPKTYAGNIQKIEKTETTETSEASKTDGGIEMLFERFRKASNAIIEMDRNNLPSEYNAKFAEILSNLKKWLVGTEVDTNRNPVMETPILDAIEKQQADSKKYAKSKGRA